MQIPFNTKRLGRRRTLRLHYKEHLDGGYLLRADRPARLLNTSDGKQTVYRK